VSQIDKKSENRQVLTSLGVSNVSFGLKPPPRPDALQRVIEHWEARISTTVVWSFVRLSILSQNWTIFRNDRARHAE
jgi:hypothetical protein